MGDGARSRLQPLLLRAGGGSRPPGVRQAVAADFRAWKRARERHAVTYALVDPDESVRARAQELELARR